LALAIESGDVIDVEAQLDYLIPGPSPFEPQAPATPGTELMPYDEAAHAAAVLRQAHRM
jgi:hypothetical protein